ncbi:MAG: hypothetical protein KDK07_08095 [Bauldia sp.]|nr:hypothetical protein [Bauldia sp.]
MAFGAATAFVGWRGHAVPAMAAGGGLFVIGLLVSLLFPRSEATLVLKTSSGDVRALTARDTDRVAAVKAAIEEAFDERTLRR